MKKIMLKIFLVFLILSVFGCNLPLKGDSLDEMDYERSHIEQIKPGPATDKLVFIPVEDTEVVNALNNNSIDIYLGSLSPKEANKLKDNDNIELIFAPSQQFDISFNIAPSTEDELNPFSIKEIRNVMNNLIDRKDLIDEVFNGYAITKPTSVFEASPDYEVVKDIVKKYDLSHNPEYAKSVIDEQMIKVGAYKINGTWHYNEKPVIIKYAIYAGGDYGEVIELSDYVSKAIEGAGFIIEKIYYDSNTPNDERVLRKDPAELKWNIRTGTGIYYGFSQFSIYEISVLAPIYKRGAPGSRTEQFWVYDHPVLDNVAIKLREGNYSDEREWKELFRQGTDILLNESYTVSLVAKQTIFAVNSRVKDFYTGDFTGIRSLQNYREVNIPRRDKINIGTTETYNKADGLNLYWLAGNIYRMDIKMAIRDFGIWSNPKTLEYEKLRWDYEIITAGPFDKLDVPTDAIQWSSEDNMWVSVEENTQATTKVTFDMSKYINTNWHHGVPISWADVLYQIVQNRERVYNQKWNEITEDSPLRIEPFIAYKINNVSLEVYVNNWHFNNGEIAHFSQITIEPWLLHLATNLIVYEDNLLMYTSSKKDKFDVPVMRLIEKDQIQIVLDKINSMAFEDIKPYFTIGDTLYVTNEEFNSRKKALNKWAQEKEHLIIGEGGFYFDSFDKETGKVTLSAFRDSTYPFKKGDFSIKN